MIEYFKFWLAGHLIECILAALIIFGFVIYLVYGLIKIGVNNLKRKFTKTTPPG